MIDLVKMNETLPEKYRIFLLRSVDELTKKTTTTALK